VQLAGLARLSFDPATKLLLTRYGGLADVGRYEMASRMVLQLRGIIIAANQVVVPMISRWSEQEPERIVLFYKRCFRWLIWVAMPMFGALALALPAISHLWLGEFDGTFIAFGTMLCCMWAINTMAGPAYIFNLGTWRLSDNTVSDFSIGLCNIALALIGGAMFGVIGVVGGWGLALAIGSVFLIVRFHKENRILLRETVRGADLRLVCTCSIAGALGASVLCWAPNMLGPFTRATIALVLFTTAIAWNFWAQTGIGGSFKSQLCSSLRL
jgi:O-antigen/teichoic acid export membrane protein